MESNKQETAARLATILRVAQERGDDGRDKPNIWCEYRKNEDDVLVNYPRGREYKKNLYEVLSLSIEGARAERIVAARKIAELLTFEDVQLTYYCGHTIFECNYCYEHEECSETPHSRCASCSRESYHDGKADHEYEQHRAGLA